MKECHVDSKMHRCWIRGLMVGAYATQYICQSRFNFTVTEYGSIYHDTFMLGDDLAKFKFDEHFNFLWFTILANIICGAQSGMLGVILVFNHV